MLKLCLQGKKDEARAYWDAECAPRLGRQALADGYDAVADQRWWLWCDRFGEAALGRAALQRLLATDALAWDASQSLLRAALPHIRALPAVRTHTFAPVPAVGDGFRASSPCVLPNPDDPAGFLVVVRHVNYDFNPDNTYTTTAAWRAAAPAPLRDAVRTRYAVHVCDAALTPLTTRVLADTTALLRWPSPVLDLEDLRVVALGSRLVGLACSRELLVTTQPQVALVGVALDDAALTDGVRLVAPTDDAEACQKNWLPIVADGTLKAMYALGPDAVLLDVNMCTGECTAEQTWHTGLAAHAVRGGAAPVPWPDGGFLAVTHTSLQDPGVRRKYFHRFVRLSPAYRPVAVSELWNFSGTARDAEFVLSAARASPTSYFLGYGQNDGACHVAEVAVATIRDLIWLDV